MATYVISDQVEPSVSTIMPVIADVVATTIGLVTIPTYLASVATAVPTRPTVGQTWPRGIAPTRGGP